MYEENLRPLPPGDAAQVFAEDLQAIERVFPATPPATTITPDHVVQWGRKEILPHFAKICRRLLLPGSDLMKAESLAELTRLAREGGSGVLCLNHRSNLDVPTFYVLLEDHGQAELFHRIIWIAGRKLHEDVGMTRILIQGVNRVIVTPKSWLSEGHTQEELHAAHQINIAAHRAIHELKDQGWVFGLFPSATRMRPHDVSTARAIEETDSFLKNFDYMLLARIDGCTLPVSRDRDLTHETPTLDRMRYLFGQVQRTDQWRASAAGRFHELDQREAAAQAIMEDIAALGPADTE